MGGHIRLDKDLLDDPRILELTEKLAAIMRSGGVEDRLIDAIACNAVIGGCYRLWRHADTHLRRYDRLNTALHGYARLEDVTGIPSSLLMQFPPDWLKDHGDGTFELPGYAAKNALVDKDERREKTRARVRRWRTKQRAAAKNGNAEKSVTDEALHRYKSVSTGPGSGPGPGTGPTGPGPGTEPGGNGAVAPADPAGQRARPEEERRQVDALVQSLVDKYTPDQIVGFGNVKIFGVTTEEVKAISKVRADGGRSR